MLPWQDDNALFFKLIHIQEQAGFLGSGIFGIDSAYKYTAFFYYPIYLIFGLSPFFYFAFGFLLYFLSTFIIYKISSSILGKTGGMLAGFLYACGFIGSDSFIRIFNSVITSLSIILVSLFLYSYWKFFKKKKILWYLISLFFFIAASEFAPSRTHYLILVAIIFELLFFTFRQPRLKSFIFSLTRISLFVPIFYKYIILEDARSFGGLNFVLSILKGNLYNLFGFLSSLSQLILPNWLIQLLVPGKYGSQTFISNAFFYICGLLIFVLLLTTFLFIKFPKKRFITVLFIITSLVWGLIARNIFTTPIISNSTDILMAFLGGELLIISLLSIFFINKRYRLLYIFLLTGIIANLLSYSAYNPLQIYEKINRYLSHSFLFLVCLLSLIYVSARNKKISNTILIAIIIWGLGNLVESYLFQRQILSNRTSPVKSFYQQLKTSLPKINKGDILYFDVEDGSQGNFADAFSVAQMPDSTALAWRYNLDRYDFQMFQNTTDFFDYLNQNKVEQSHIHTFFYTNGILNNTTEDLVSLLKQKEQSNLEIHSVDSTSNKSSANGVTLLNKSSLELDKLKITNLVPSDLIVDIKAKALKFTNSDFPLYYGSDGFDEDSSNINNLEILFEYKNYLASFRKNTLISTSSDWQGREANNLIDGDYNSVWEADRTSWLKSPQYLFLTTDTNTFYNKLVFVNTFSDHTPLEFDILGSNNQKDWTLIKTYLNGERLSNNQEVVVGFEPQKFKYFKLLFKKTLNSDSPVVSELWLVPAKFSMLDILKTENFLINPFAIVPTKSVYDSLLSYMNLTGVVKLSWTNNKNFGWQSSPTSFAGVIFDGKVRQYKIPLIPGGTTIDKLKFTVTNLPGEIEILSIKVQY